jgi:hypothetical protein
MLFDTIKLSAPPTVIYPFCTIALFLDVNFLICGLTLYHEKGINQHLHISFRYVSELLEPLTVAVDIGAFVPHKNKAILTDTVNFSHFLPALRARSFGEKETVHQ